MEKYLSATAVAILILTIISVHGQSVKGEKFYIVTTPDSPCPMPGGNESGSGSGEGQECLTLQQFITSFDNFSHIANLILELEPGEHNLQVDFYLYNHVSFVMISEAATINCSTQSYVGFELVYIEDIIIEGITFMGCRNILIYNSSQFQLENSSLQMSEQGAVALAYILNITITGSTISGDEVDTAALYIVNGSSVYLQKCIFSHLQTKAIQINDSTIIMDSCTFENNSLDHSAMIKVLNDIETVTITNCSFIRNNMMNSTFGAVFIESRGSIMIHSNSFIENNGELVYITGFRRMYIHDNLFLDNAGPGAALNVNATHASLTFSQNNFTSNADGAVNLLVSDSSVNISDSYFSGNTKRENGGAAVKVYEFDDSYNGYGSNLLRISRSMFFNNSAYFNGSGGALHISVDSPLSEVSINLSNFSNNCAQSAGAVYVETCVNCTFGITLTTFDNNTATEGHAGAVAIEGETIHAVFLLNSTFINNTAPHSHAGAIYIDAADTDMMGSTFMKNSAQNCGAIGLNSGHTDIIESTFIANSVVMDGGVICAYPAVDEVSILTGNFSYNHAQRNGGVLITQPLANGEYGNESIFLRIRSSSCFYHNIAGAQGGVFATFIQSKFDVASSSFLSNQAGIEGGVMYVSGSNSSVVIQSISYLGFNNATNRGGVISINGSSVFISGTSIFNNSASLGPVISACNSDVRTFPGDVLFQYQDQNFPNCVLYDLAANQPTTTAAVTTSTVPPTRARQSNDIAVAIAVPIVCLLVLALFVATIFAFAYWRGYLKCKKSVNAGDGTRYGVLKADDPDYAPLMDNA